MCGMRAVRRALNHHFFGRAQREIREIALDAVDIPLQSRQVDSVAIVVIGDMSLVSIHKLIHIGPWA